MGRGYKPFQTFSLNTVYHTLVNAGWEPCQTNPRKKMKLISIIYYFV